MRIDPNAWWKQGVFYQIYPRSFSDSNQDGIGDLKGITKKLDYLQDLGVDAIWLSPINPSPDKDFGYDVSDYLDIDPKYGTMKDFELLIQEGRKRDIHVILDLVLNHSSDQHHWFLESKKSRNNPFHDFYIWHDPAKGGGQPNNWRSIFGGKGWEFVPGLGQYYYHMFVKEQPDLNWRNPTVRKELLDVFRFWLKKGVDGFRLDVFNNYFKDVQFRNNPRNRLGIRPFDCQTHLYDTDQPEMIPLLKDIRRILDSKPGSYAVGETFMGREKIAAKYCAPGLLPGTFNFSLVRGAWNARTVQRKITKWDQAVDAESWPTQVMSNHDVHRIATRLHASQDDRILKQAAALLLTLRGTPFIYYGDEIGMRDIRVGKADLQDPVSMNYWPFPVGRDGCRSPMQWDESCFAGFSTHKPWLKVNPNYSQRNVQRQKSEKDSLFHFYRKLIHIRKENKALNAGMFLPLTYDPLFVMAYLRQTAEETVLVVLNFNRRKMKFFLGRELAKRNWKLLLSSNPNQETTITSSTLQLTGYEVCIYKVL
jgi:alpha-glucosidase